MIIHRTVLLRMRNFSDKIYNRENKGYILCSVTFFPANRAVYEITWKNTVDPERLQMTIWRMRIVCWKTKATKTHSEYVILIAFPLQQWLHERTSILPLHVYIIYCYSQKYLSQKYF